MLNICSKCKFEEEGTGDGWTTVAFSKFNFCSTCAPAWRNISRVSYELDIYKIAEEYIEGKIIDYKDIIKRLNNT